MTAAPVNQVIGDFRPIAAPSRLADKPSRNGDALGNFPTSDGAVEREGSTPRMTVVRYRLYNAKLQPRRTKLEIPGWAGQQEPRADGSHEYAWHCLPFTEAARAGIEVFYPYETELRVSGRQGEMVFESDSAEPLPFRSFGKEYFTYQILIDLKVEEGLAIKTEPQPALLHRHDGDGADRGAGADPALVANDILRRIQSSSRGADPYLPSWRAVHADERGPGR